MKNDNRTGCFASGNSPELKRYTFLDSWRRCCCYLLACLCAWGTVRAGDYTAQDQYPGAGSGSQYYWYLKMRVYLTRSDLSMPVYYRVGSGGVQTLAAGQATATAIFSCRYVWENLSNSTGPVNATPYDQPGGQIYWGLQPGTQPFAVDVPAPSGTTKVSFGGSWGHVETYRPDLMVTINPIAGTSEITAGGEASARAELLMALYNATGVPQMVKWGSKMIELAPGQNILRYDGEVGSDGLPKVKPSDFAGAQITAADGKKYVAGILETKTTGDGLTYPGWRPVTVPPTSPTSSMDQVEIIDPGNSSQGATVAIHHGNGTTTITTLPVTPGQSTSNTTGTGGVLSDPTLPKPTQTTTNTVTNITNNTTNNNNVTNNVTNVQNDGTSNDADAQAQAMANGMSGDGTLPEDKSLVPGQDLKAKQTALKDSFLAKFSNFGSVLSSSAVPKITTFPLHIPCGSYGTIDEQIHLDTWPFLLGRGLLLSAMTLGFALAFMRKITI